MSDFRKTLTESELRQVINDTKAPLAAAIAAKEAIPGFDADSTVASNGTGGGPFVAVNPAHKAIAEEIRGLTDTQNGYRLQLRELLIRQLVLEQIEDLQVTGI